MNTPSVPAQGKSYSKIYNEIYGFPAGDLHEKALEAVAKAAVEHRMQEIANPQAGTFVEGGEWSLNDYRVFYLRRLDENAALRKESEGKERENEHLRVLLAAARQNLVIHAKTLRWKIDLVLFPKQEPTCPGCGSLLVNGNGSMKCPACLSHLPIPNRGTKQEGQ